MIQDMTKPPVNPKSTIIQMRVSDEYLKLVDDWRRLEPDIPVRSEAIRRLTVLGLQVKRPKPPK
jgi:hypothetical protein